MYCPDSLSSFILSKKIAGMIKTMINKMVISLINNNKKLLIFFILKNGKNRNCNQEIFDISL